MSMEQLPQGSNVGPQLLSFVEDRAPGSPISSSLLQNKEHDSAAEIQSPDTQKRTSHAHLPPPPRATDPTLDFFSPQFDALKALYADLRRPNEWVAPLNTLAQCRFILPEEMRESLAHLQQVSSKTREEVEEQRNKSGPARVRRQASEWKESAVEKIAQQVRKGPLLLLQQCYFLGARVRVATRHARGVRGNCTGVLKAFDKHMNLVLQDVVEHYTVRLRVERTKLVHVTDVVDAPMEDQGAEGEPAKKLEVRAIEKSRTCYRQDHRSRKLKQIFVRGNNVVTISSCQPDKAADTTS